MNKARAYILAARPKTLPAAVIPVMVGGGLAYSQATFILEPWLLCLVFALLIQVGTNFANDVCDFESGADDARRIGPARAVVSGWIRPREMRLAMWGVYGLALLVGSGLVAYGGWPLLVIGILSVMCGYAYTGGPYPLGYHGLGDLFVFIFFGWVATGFTYYVQSGTFEIVLSEAGWLRYSGVWLAGVVPGALATNLLVVNNYRDAPLDAEAGKRTLIVRFGRGFGAWLYGVLNLLAVAVVPLLFLAGGFSAWMCLTLAVVPLSLRVQRLLVTAATPEGFGRVLSMTALEMLLAGVLFTSGLISS